VSQENVARVSGALALPKDHPLRLACRLNDCQKYGRRVLHSEVLEILALAGIKIGRGHEPYESCPEAVQNSHVCGTSHAPIRVVETVPLSAYGAVRGSRPIVKMANSHFVEFNTSESSQKSGTQMVKYTFPPIVEDPEPYADESIFCSLIQISRNFRQEILDLSFSSTPRFCPKPHHPPTSTDRTSEQSVIETLMHAKQPMGDASRAKDDSSEPTDSGEGSLVGTDANRCADVLS
jgi:hypothetical protein